jgi:regulator of sigma E protease
MEFVIKISQFLLSLSLLIVLHELGHFIPAKLFKTRVEKFYLFFDVKYSLFKKKIGDTVYGIGWLPLGGYVKISGMIDESMDTEQMSQEPQPWEFRSKPSWQRLIIMLGGVTVNFILAAVIYIFMAFSYGDSDVDVQSITDGYWISNPLFTELGFRTGDNITAINEHEIVKFSDLRKHLLEAQLVSFERDGKPMTIEFPEDFLGQLSSSNNRTFFELRQPFIVSKVLETSPNSNQDLQQGDLLTGLDNKSLKYYDEFTALASDSKGKTLSATILRDGKTLEKTLRIDDNGKFGIYNSLSSSVIETMGYYKIIENEYTFGESVGVGFNRFTSQMSSYWGQLKLIFSPSTGAYKGVGGFKAIFDIFPATWSWEAFWGITALLSIMLGVLNLLPIPALDGGHVMFLLYEMVSGRKPSDKFMEYAQTAGFFLLISLVLFANGNDIFKAIFG